MQSRYFACIFAVSVAIFQFCFCANISPTSANQITAAQLMAGGKALFVDYYYDDLPGLVFLRLPQVQLADWLRSLPLPALPMLGGDASYFGAYSVAHADVLAHFLVLMAFQSAILIFIGRVCRLCRSTSSPLLLLAVLFSLLSFPFQTSCAQHYLFLALLPLIFSLVAKNSLQVKFSALLLYLSVLLAAVFCGLSIWFLPLPFILILAAALQSTLEMKRRWLEFLPLLLFCLLIECLTVYGQWQTIGAEGRFVVWDWIWSFRRSTLIMEDMTIFGYKCSVDRRDLLYLFAVLLPMTLSMSKKLLYTAPFVLLAVYGMGLYMCSSSYLSDSLVLSSAALFTLLFYLGVSTYYGLPRHYPRFLPFLFRPALLYAVLSISLVALVSMPFLTLARLTKLIGDFKLTGPQDLRQAIVGLTRPGDSVLILTGRLTPACPELLLTGRKPVGYFINGEPVGMVMNYLRHKADGAWVGRELTFVKDKVIVVVDHLRQDILAQKPDYIMVEGGDMDTFLHEQSLYALLEKHYKDIDFCNWRSENTGPREFSDWNYDMAIYKRKDKK